MFRLQPLYILGLFVGIIQNADASTAALVDTFQRLMNEEAYLERFDRASYPDELSGIRVSPSDAQDSLADLSNLANPNWKMTLMTGDDSINAFDNARKELFDLFSDYGIDEAIQLSRDPKEQVGGVRATSVANLQQAAKDLNIKNGDGCLVHMTSHGTTSGFYIRGQSYLTPSKLDQILDSSCGKHPTVLLVSACYSGIFAEPGMEAPNRVILTAARKDRSSFGCSPEAKYTYWDGCVIDNLPTSVTWLELAGKVEKCIERKESSGGFKRSYPQARFGADVIHLEIRQ